MCLSFFFEDHCWALRDEAFCLLSIYWQKGFVAFQTAINAAIIEVSKCPASKTCLKSVLLPRVSCLPPPPPSCPLRRGCSVAFSEQRSCRRTASCFPAQRCGTALSRCPVLRRRLSARAGGAILAHSIRSVARWAFRPRPLSSASPFQQHSSRQYLTTISFFPSYQDLLAFTVAPETNTLFPLNIFIS